MFSFGLRAIPNDYVYGQPLTCLLKFGSPVFSVCVVCIPRVGSVCWAAFWGHQENVPTLCTRSVAERFSEKSYSVLAMVWISVPMGLCVQSLVPSLALLGRSKAL